MTLGQLILWCSQKGWASQCTENSIHRHHQGYIGEKLKRIERRTGLQGDIDDVVNTFCWSGTPQGHEYWSRIAQG